MNTHAFSRVGVQSLALSLLLLGGFGCASPSQLQPTATPLAETAQSSVSTPAAAALADTNFSGAIRQVAGYRGVLQRTNDRFSAHAVVVGSWQPPQTYVHKR